GGAPGYQQQEVGDALQRGGLVTVASGRDDAAAIMIGNAGAAMFAARLRPESSIELPDAPYLHLFVPLGRVTLADTGALDQGDAVRFTGGGGERVTAVTASEILIWAMDRRLGG